MRRADNERDAAKAKLAAEQEYGEEAYPILTDGRLSGRKVGLVLLGKSDTSPDEVREWLDPTGASLSFVAELRDDVDLKALAERARGTRYDGVADDPELVGELRERVGIQMAQGGKLVQRLRPALLQSVSGEIGDLDGVIVVRPPKQPGDKAQADRLTALQDGVVRGLGQTGAKVVGIEPSDSEPSQIGWYRDRELSTVDNVDENAGRAALVFVLAGADGAFGRREGAQHLLPPVVATAPQQRP